MRGFLKLAISIWQGDSGAAPPPGSQQTWDNGVTWDAGIHWD